MPLGYVEVTPDRVVALGDRGALLLVDLASNLALPIFIGGTEAISIDGRLRGDTPNRPLTHDLLDHALGALHASLVKVQVDELRQTDDGGVFIGSIFVRANGRIIKLDARPSDAIALAIGNHAPIYVARSVLAQAGVAWDELQKQVQAAASGAST
jgi:bifunctional DNase/RNase